MKLRLYGPNILFNGGAELGAVNSWALYTRTDSGASATLNVNTATPYSGAYDFFINIASGGLSVGDIQLYQHSINAPKSVPVAIHFAGKGEDNRSTQVVYRLGASPWTEYYTTNASLSTAYQPFEFSFVPSSDITSGQIIFNCGSGPVAQDIWLDEIGVRNYIELPTTYEYSAAESLIRKDIRTKAGNLYSYIEPYSFRRFTLPLVHVNSADRSLINSWWATGSELRFVEDSTYPFSFSNVRIVGNSEPLTKFMPPYNGEYEGELVLETV